MINKKRKKVLEKAKKNGGISGRDARQIYDSKSSAYRVLNDLSSKGFLKKCSAPENSSNTYIFMITDKGKTALSLFL